jgi:guanine deaminase
MCIGAILWSRIGSLYYAATTEMATTAGFDDGAFYRVLGVDGEAIDPSSGILTITQIDLPNARAPFDTWSRTPNAPRY